MSLLVLLLLFFFLGHAGGLLCVCVQSFAHLCIWSACLIMASLGSSSTVIQIMQPPPPPNRAVMLWVKIRTTAKPNTGPGQSRKKIHPDSPVSRGRRFKQGQLSWVGRGTVEGVRNLLIFICRCDLESKVDAWVLHRPGGFSSPGHWPRNLQSSQTSYGIRSWPALRQFRALGPEQWRLPSPLSFSFSVHLPLWLWKLFGFGKAIPTPQSESMTRGTKEIHPWYWLCNSALKVFPNFLYLHFS